MITRFFVHLSTTILLVASFWLIPGFVLLRRELRFGRRACSAQAVIVNLKRRTCVRRGRRGGTGLSASVYPVVEFYREDAPFAGQRVTCELPIGWYPPLYAIGARLPVLYDPSDLKLVEFNTFRGRWLGICIWFALNLLLFLLGTGMLLFAVNRMFHS